MSSSQTIQLVVLAAIAVFLILRLRSVLGTRDGFEPSEKPEAATAHRHLRVVGEDEDEEDDDPDGDIAAHVDLQSPAAHALRGMRKVEPGFSIGDFLSGARQAYEMIVMAFETSKLDPVRGFLAPPVAEAFDQAIAAREASGQVIEAEYMGTSETTLIAADFNPDTKAAEITIRFVGELNTTTRDREGNIIPDQKRKARKQRDTWTFARKMGDADPNWLLIATG